MLFWDLLNVFYGFLDAVLFVPWASNSSFRQGFITGLIVALVLAAIGRTLLRWRAAISRFFRATREPATNDGPIPVNMFGGCVGASFGLGLTTVFVVVLIILRFW